MSDAPGQWALITSRLAQPIDTMTLLVERDTDLVHGISIGGVMFDLDTPFPYPYGSTMGVRISVEPPVVVTDDGFYSTHESTKGAHNAG